MVSASKTADLLFYRIVFEECLPESDFKRAAETREERRKHYPPKKFSKFESGLKTIFISVSIIKCQRASVSIEAIKRLNRVVCCVCLDVFVLNKQVHKNTKYRVKKKKIDI